MRQPLMHAIVTAFKKSFKHYPSISDITISSTSQKGVTLTIHNAPHTIGKKIVHLVVDANMNDDEANEFLARHNYETEKATARKKRKTESLMRRKCKKTNHVIKLFDVPACQHFVSTVKEAMSKNGHVSAPFITREIANNKKACLHVGDMFVARGFDALSSHAINQIDIVDVDFIAGDVLSIKLSYYVQAGDVYDTFIHYITMGKPESWFSKIVLDEHHIDDTFSAMTMDCSAALDALMETIYIVSALAELPYYIKAQPVFAKELRQEAVYSVGEFTDRITRIKHTLNTLSTLYDEGISLRHKFGEDWLLEQYTGKRSGKRKVIIYAGPTNSGKTYHSIQHIKTLGKHAYLAPLRLLAMEVADTLNSENIICSLVTGEERTLAPGATVTASTIEMANLDQRYDSVIVDEAQMIADEHRGSAWTRAILGVNASTLVLCCAPNAIEPLKHLVALAGDTDVEVVTLERMTSLQAHKKAFDITQPIKPGTAIVAFSKSMVLQIKQHLESQGNNVSAIYGALPPEVRRNQAHRFTTGETDIVVATDAIGMGMNLPIEQVIFTSHEKYNGTETKGVEEGLVKQIAGRAGRYGKYETGFYGAIDSSTLAYVRNQVLSPPETLPLDFYLSPSPEVIIGLAKAIDSLAFDDIIHHFIRFATSDPRFKADQWLAPLSVYHATKDVLSTLPLETQIPLLMSPCNADDATHVELIIDGCVALLNGDEVNAPETPRLILMTLGQLEQAVSLFNLYRYLHYRFPSTYPFLNFVTAKLQDINHHIEEKLIYNSGNVDFLAAGFN